MSTPSAPYRALSYANALREAVEQEMERDASVFLFGLDVDDHKAILGSTQGLLARFGPSRVFNTPLSEDAMTGVAIGAAMAGMRPIHVHIRMDFLMLCMNQLINIAAKAHYMYGGTVRVPLVVRCIIGKSWGQGAQHSQSLYSMFMHVPGLRVIIPSNAYDAKGALIAAIRDDNPVIFVEHRLLYGTEAHVPPEPYAIELGRARICCTGGDITVVGISNMVVEALRARDLVSELGIDVEVIDPVSLVPLDIDTIVQSAQKTRRLLIIDNAWTTCGAGAEIIAQIIERTGSTAGILMRRLGFAPTTCPTTPALERLFYPTPSSIASVIDEMVTGRVGWLPDADRIKAMQQEQFRGPF